MFIIYLSSVFHSQIVAFNINDHSIEADTISTIRDVLYFKIIIIYGVINNYLLIVLSDICPFLSSIAELRKATVMSVCPSVLPYEIAPLPLDGFPPNFILECFSKICRENSSVIKL